MSCCSLRWKKSGAKRPQPPTTFEIEKDDESSVDSLSFAPKVSRVAIEDQDTRFERLKSEGVFLAEAEKFWQAINTWRRALEVRPEDASVLEMTSQALMQVHEWEPAIESATAAIVRIPNWWEAHQTLGRAYVGLGSVREARRAFSKACHLMPADQELRTEDLLWCQKLYRHLLAEEEADKL